MKENNIEIPFHTETPVHYLSIDGGTSTVGLCYFYVKDNTMQVVKHQLLDVSGVDHQYDYYQARHSSLTVRLKRLRNQLVRFMKELPVPPEVVYYESHFINPRRPTSVIPLARFMQVVEDIMLDHGVTVVYIAPQQMKRKVNVTGKLAKANKFAVRDAIQKIVESGTIRPNESLFDISEHEVDAVGIGYTGLLLDQLLN